MADDTIQSEAGIVLRYLAPLAAALPGAFGLQDDCGLLTPEPGKELVFKTDPIIAGVHFFADDAPGDIAWKALAVNISDLAAKGAAPLAYLMALALPQAPAHTWMAEFASGLRDAQTAFGCHLLGGDTDRTPGPLTVSITAIGTVPAGRMVRRGTAKAGDLIFVSGSIGDAHLGLRLRRDPSLARQYALPADHAEYLLDCYLRPQPRVHIAQALLDHASAAMDLSDGLIKDLGRMCAASGVAARVRAADVPLSRPAMHILSAGPELFSALVTGGDDYEILAAIAPNQAVNFERAAHANGVDVTCIGQFVEGAGVAIERTNGPPMVFERTGWDHF